MTGYLPTGLDRPQARQVALFGLVAAVLRYFISSHLSLIYLYFPLIPLLYLFEGRGEVYFSPAASS